MLLGFLTSQEIFVRAGKGKWPSEPSIREHRVISISSESFVSSVFNFAFLSAPWLRGEPELEFVTKNSPQDLPRGIPRD